MRKVITKQFILDEKNDKELSDLGLLSYSIRYRKMGNDCDFFSEKTLIPCLDTELISNTLIKNGFAIEYINEGDFLVFCNKKEGACIVSYKPNEDGADIEFNDPSLICELRDYIQFKDDSGYYFPVLYGYYEYYIFVANSFMDNNAKFIPPTSYKKINHPYIFFTQLGYKLVEEFDTGRMIFMKN